MAILNFDTSGADRKERDPAPAFSGPAQTGGTGDDASCGFFDDDCARRGGPGGTGANGVQGAEGGPGGHAGILQIEATSFDIVLTLSARGGAGGRGGRGGDGQQGGKGGRGGDGEECENGGMGGDGGRGGNGALGGRGGDGGNGGIIMVIAENLTVETDTSTLDAPGGAGGEEGNAGLPGRGGDPGDSGPSPGTFSPSSDCDRRPPNVGDPGSPPFRDDNVRRSGVPGTRGIATRRPAPPK